MIKKLLPFFRRYRVATILCPLIVILEVAVDVMMPYMMSYIVDIGIANRDVDYILRMGFMMIGLAVVALGFGILSARLGAVAAIGVGSEVRRGLFVKIQSFSFKRLDKFGIPSLITRLTTDITHIQNSVMVGLRMMFRGPFMLVLALIMAFSINRQLSLVFLCAIPVLGVSLFMIMRNAVPRFRTLQKKFDQLNSTVQENLISIRVIKAFVRSDFEKERFSKDNNDLRQSAMRAVKLVILNMPIMQLIVFACIIAILWFGGDMVRSGEMLTGQLISFISYVNQIMMGLMMLSFAFIMTIRAKASAERVVEVLDTDPGMEEQPAEKTAELEVDSGSIEFRNVWFKYSERAKAHILSDINLKINSGEVVGIIGSTGSSKTSLVQLIPRLYDATDGQVLVDGRDVREYSLETLRDSVAVVLQNNTLFSGSIRENLHWGDASAGDEELMRACRIAQAAEFIEDMPEGLDTQLGQGGVNLSGGQKQRLCIARALLKSPKVLILDDSTSAVDTATDTRLRKGFAENLNGVTVIIIAQRITSIQHADRIVVMEDGQIDAIGNHDELMKTSEVYREVYTSQQKGAMKQ